MKSYEDHVASFEDAYEAHLDSMEPGNLYADWHFPSSSQPSVQVGSGDHADGEEPTDYYVNHDGNQLWFETLGAALDYCNLNELEIDYLG